MDRYAEHRRRLAHQIGTDGMAVIPAATELERNPDVNHQFRQDSDFFYLTGFEEPDAVCVLVPGHPDGDFHLFVRPRDRDAEIWNGFRAGVEGAKDRYQADAAYELGELDAVLPQLMVGRDTLHYQLGRDQHDQRIRALLDRARSYRTRVGRVAPDTLRDISSILSEQRLRKSASEIESIRAACELSAEGHREAIRFTRPGLYEYQVQAAMEHVWREGGSPRNAYPAIVASGPNAIVLHYESNDRLIEDGDLILIDAGCEVDYYASDITRTFPANGTFTSPQRAVYEVVLEAHREAIRMCKPGATIRDVHDRAVEVLTEGMIELGLLPRSLEESLAMHHYQTFFMHGTSHWLGLDVHDVGPYRVDGRSVTLEPGMVLTVEPGLYIAPDRPEVELSLLAYDRDEWMERRVLEGAAAAKQKEREATEAAESIRHPVPPHLCGIGIRIEDDILITEDGHENLTRMVPTDVDRVEALSEEPSWLRRE